VLNRFFLANGISGLFKGLSITMLRETPACVGWFWGYEIAKRNLTPNSLDPLLLMVCGSFGGICYWTACYPFDVIKSIIQTQSDNLPKSQSSILTVLKRILRTEGILGLWKGYPLCIMRSIPAASSTFVTYELVSNYLKKITIT